MNQSEGTVWTTTKNHSTTKHCEHVCWVIRRIVNSPKGRPRKWYSANKSLLNPYGLCVLPFPTASMLLFWNGLFVLGWETYTQSIQTISMLRCTLQVSAMMKKISPEAHFLFFIYFFIRVLFCRYERLHRWELQMRALFSIPPTWAPHIPSISQLTVPAAIRFVFTSWLELPGVHQSCLSGGFCWSYAWNREFSISEYAEMYAIKSCVAFILMRAIG